MKKIFLLLSIVILSLALVSCSKSKVDIQKDVVEATDVTKIGEGEKEFVFTVITDDGVKSVFKVSTDKDTVGEALVDNNLIGGEDSAYGMFVKTVNSVTYDFNKDGKYWAFYINGEYAVSGVDKTPITEGNTYMFKAE